MKKLTPIKSIRAFCLQCAGTSPDVRDCTANEEDIAKIAPEDDQADFIVCPLYPYRLGKRPRGVAIHAGTKEN